ncbi:hypothetical protein TREMEDRAFT_61472 [Tremella mesenterica DSM 1558]|uniref:uncharacterized protein n=1 Tax=Tremella mesenterica (strain ATCC 24925 / CBS 8224 / DSM 1558 / NBRC 9311 / NRRL Y-6157 / RJB 2259-6 / UBC 559-6) TaxID=578456 RepID=UPI0003F48FD7|nr:uncharacterized protein TREMEDRAFT_61472 [Tremella mesenterica DSM 1558]EIW69713.1 hypothetical protein TREMEDRAFT_61472 [Tremella mesenterica DSM 1558]
MPNHGCVRERRRPTSAPHKDHITAQKTSRWTLCPIGINQTSLVTTSSRSLRVRPAGPRGSVTICELVAGEEDVMSTLDDADMGRSRNAYNAAVQLVVDLSPPEIFVYMIVTDVSE